MRASGAGGGRRGPAALRRPGSHGPAHPVDVAAEAAAAVAGPAAAAAGLQVHLRRGALLPPGAAVARSSSPGPGLAAWRRWTRSWRAW